jgi:hypothetical protein
MGAVRHRADRCAARCARGCSFAPVKETEGKPTCCLLAAHVLRPWWPAPLLGIALNIAVLCAVCLF